MAEKLKTKPNIQNDERDQAEMSRTLANKAIVNGAEKFLTIVNQHKSSVDRKIQRYLNPVQDLLETITSEMKDNAQLKEQDATKPKNENNIKLENKNNFTLISIANDALNDKDYDFAELLLTYLKVEQNNETAKNSLKDIQALPSKPELTEQEELQRRCAKCCQFAVNMMLENRFEEAETILIIAQILDSNYGGINTLLTECRSKLYGADPELFKERKALEDNFLKQPYFLHDELSLRQLKYNSYMQLAIRAHLAGKNHIAKDFLFEAEKDYPSMSSSSSKAMDALFLMFPSLNA